MLFFLIWEDDMNILHPFMDKVLSEDMMKKNNEMGGNIPGGNFSGGIFQEGVWWAGIFRELHNNLNIKKW